MKHRIQYNRDMKGKDKEEKMGSNNLINRLFKNHTFKARTPSLNITSQIMQSQPQSAYLVPKITKNKLKPIQPDKRLRSKIFSNHQILTELQKSQSKPTNVYLDATARSPTLSKVRSKMYSLIDDNNQYQEKRKEIQIEQKPFLTPQDFMQILKIDREMSDQFCYMNKRDNPYDWQIVQFQKKNPNQYMVISKRGLTKYIYSEVQFMKFEQFLQEQKIFNSLNKIDYFRLYARKKHFQIWKKYTSMVIFKERAKQFGERTLLNDIQIKEIIQQSKRICKKIQNIQTFYCQTINSMSVDDFHLYVQNQKNKTVGKISQIEQLILQMIKEKSEISMNLYMKKMRISKQKESLNDKKIPLLIGDETGKQMPYTKEATIRTHQERIRNLLKLVDYLVITSKNELIINMVDFLMNIIKDITLFYQSQKKSFSSNSWVVIELYEQEGILLFTPEEQLFLEQMEDIIMGTLSQICTKHFQFLHLPQFQEYWKCKIQSQLSDEFIELKKIIENNNEFNEKFTQYKCIIKNSFNHAKNYSAIFQPSLEYLKYMRQLQKHDFDNQNVQFFKEVLSKCRQQMKNIGQIQNIKQIGIISLNCLAYKQVVEKKSQELNNRIYSNIPNVLHKRSQQLLKDIKTNYDLITFNPLTIQEYIVFLKNTQKVTAYFEQTQPLINDNSMLLTLSQAYSIKINDNVRNLIGEANGQMIGLSRRLSEIQKNGNDLAQKFKKQIQKLIPTFRERIKQHGDKLTQAELLKNNEELAKKVKKLTDLSESLAVILNEKNELRKNQEQLGLDVTDFQDIDKYQNYFKNIQSLYSQKSKWMQFTDKIWKKIITLINFQETKKYLEMLTKKMAVFMRQIEPNEVLQLFKLNFQSIKPLFYAVQACQNKFLQDKHKQQMRILIREHNRDKPFVKDPQQIQFLFKDFNLPYYNFQFFKALGFDVFKQEFVQIAIQAEKQAELIDMITKVENIWRIVAINTTSFKEGKQGNILGNNDDLITKIDDNLMVVNNILASKYVGPIKHRVELQSKMLRYVQDLMDQWYLHQKNWIYLEPILKSPFALKNLPKQTAMFNQIDTKWKVIMKQAKDSVNIKKYADQYVTNYTLKVLRINNQTFQIIQKTLQNFLQKKRDLFQRFYFLSNDELLQILSTVKAFQQIQPYLRKVFQNFVGIRFDDKSSPTYMVSMQGQQVQLRNCVFRGEVEQWFKSCEQSMKNSLKSIVRQGMLKYTQAGIKRPQWINLFPSQVVLVVDCIMWTNITEGYLQNLDQNDINQWYQTNVHQLSELVEIIRTDLSSLQRKTLVALITQDVHFRDIVQSLQSCESITDFKWLQQLRFYNINQNVFARQVQTQLAYGYQYLGATTRLVITPLTDRCWITITGALHIKLGANPAGPAGTGKTESCKDLAKSLARYCIVFNCSDQINATMMQKLFSGLAYTGSWTCLDQFNRIDIEVLSVISQQVLTIREALLLGKQNKELVLGGKTIHLNHDLGIFITMNPGYAGRTQLPDNLKTLFRPVSMMVPDYTLIAEIMLFSQGFSSAKQLSKKMTKLYKLSSEQLSQQDHYDFGMRAVKSVLVMAGGLKRAEPQVPEDIILIRAMQDSNVPKFLAHDIPLFNGIIQDLFPGVKIPKRNQQNMIEYLQNKCNELKLSPTNTFIEKNLQLSQTLKVRFGVMLVGPPMGSKTSIIKTLLPTFPMVVNPKAVSLAQLYGNFDTLTQTWTDGLAAKLLRQSASTHQYVIFDGPVDAIWVQNLNTVLDDSMMLCLSNGQRIKLSSKMRILFQVNDLNQASPATVSRCGMVWVSQEVVHWQQIINSFFEQNVVLENQQKLNFLINLVRSSFKKGYFSLKKYMRQVIKLNANTLAHSYCKFVKNMIKIIPQQSLNSDLWKKGIQKICVFSYVWTLGAIISEDSKNRFDKSLSDFFSAQSLKSPINNFTLNFKDKLQGQWVSWNMIMPEFQFPQNVSYLQVFVPTKQTFCYTTIIQRFIDDLNPIFITSPTGTGKTSIINQIIKKSGQSSLSFTFTAQTSPSIAQLQFQSKLQNLRKQGSITLVPPPGKKFIYFIDDINMPAVQDYGAQPPIEMLRLMLGSGGVWDRKNHVFKLVQGSEMIISGTYGRTQLPPRFVRFFNTIYIPQLEEDSLILIFAEITKGFFQRFKLKNQIMDLIISRSIVTSTLSLYSMIRLQLLPTPEKSHYLFNLRDVSRVFQGLTLVKQSTLNSPQTLVKLWVHEFQRVFEDRLINEKDKLFIKEQISKKVVVSLKSNLTQETLFENPIFFCNFLRKGQDRKDWLYQQAKDYTKLVKIITDYMTDQTNMNLVLFSDAVAHVTRVARALQFDKGHILLCGLSGSGKKSMITLGGIVSQCKIMQIQIRKNYGKIEFREDIFRVMKEAAFENHQICFIFPENHMIDESFLQDINNLLSSGEIPCMFNKDNLEQINQNGGYEIFLKKIITNLHVTLTLSPIGSQFRTRLRNFPSLINCCSLDWIDKWPEEALKGVANMKLDDKSVIELCVFAHKEIEQLAKQFFAETRRKVFVTAKNYISLIETFNHLLQQQRLKLDGSIGKLSNGVHKLEQANNIIEQLKAKLIEMQPILEIKTVEQQNLLKKLQVDRQQASKVKIVVEQQEKLILEKTEKALEQKKEADRILNDALPALHAANQALNTLNRNDISQIKMNQNPHAQVKFTLECVSILLQEKEDWESVRKTISDVNFITRLKNLDVYHIPAKVEQIIRAKLKTNPNFKPNDIKQINFAAKSFCEWVLAVVSFNQVNKQIVIKKQVVKKLNDQLAVSKKELQAKRDQLNKIVSKVKQLQTMFIASKDEKEKLDNEIALTKVRLVNAQELTVGLKNEKVRWNEYLIQLNQQKTSIIGNIFLSTCYVVYSGPYSGTFRQSYMQKLLQKTAELQIKTHQKFQLRVELGDNLEIADWINYNLPKDQISINNAIIVKKTIQNPIMIDPQLQASKWIKNMEKKNQMVLLKIGSDNILKRLETVLRMKYPILLQMTDNNIDPALDGLLSKDYQCVNNRYFTKIGENRLEVEKNLKIYIYTKSSNPAFNPQVFIKLCVINFTVTPEGLSDQLLADVVESEVPEVENKKRQLLLTISKGRILLAKNQDNILALLNNSKGFILDDIELIKNLKQSKKVSAEVNVSLQESVIKSKQIDQAREVYKPVAARGALLYLIVTDLSAIESMYQFSLQYFNRIFKNVLANTESSENVDTRVENLLNALTQTIYVNISRALFNQHKKIFSFIMACRIKQIPKLEYDYFNKGDFALPKVVVDKNKKTKQSVEPLKVIPGISSQVNRSLQNLKKVFPNTITEHFSKDKERIHQFLLNTLTYTTSQTFLKDHQPLSAFQTLLLIKVIRPEFTVEAISHYIKQTLGQLFIDSNSPAMQQIYNDTINKIPLTFILSVGADPLQNLLRLSKDIGKKTQDISIISLGQGQGPPALRAIESSTKDGKWVILQNCHLGKSFLPSLQKKIEEINQSEQIHEQFRLFLTVMPCDYFPISILQNSLKVTSEPPRGIKANLKKLMNNVSWGQIQQQKTFSFNLCLFHAIVLQRRKFGSLGWNILYDFNESDLQTSLTVVSNLLNSYQDIPYDAIQYFVGQIIYGGRVTDQFDRRLLKTQLYDYISFQSIQKPRVKPGDPSVYKTFIDNLNEFDDPSMFGLNDNAQKTYMMKITKQTLESILMIQPQEVSTASGGQNASILLINDILNRMPPVIKKNQDKKTVDAIDICLLQQSVRFNKLILYMEKTLKQLLQAIKGEAIMTEILEKIFISLNLNQVPKEWEKRAYPSMKSLSSWFEDLLERVKFIRQGVIQKPRLYWISAFFFPQGFLTSVLQIFARKTKLPVDSLGFSFIFKQQTQKEFTESTPSDGCLIYGLYSEACCIDFKNSFIKQSPPNVLDCEVPVIHFKPIQTAKLELNFTHYECPVYKTKKRAGTLSTTGHSTNYIISVVCKSEMEDSYWTKRGAAFFCALQK